MELLRLNSYTLSRALGRQLLEDMIYEKDMFINEVMPVIRDRLNDKTLQREDSGSILVGSAATLYLIAKKLRPVNVLEVGTYIGCSTATIACGCDGPRASATITTCDINKCIEDPLEGLSIQGSITCRVLHGMSTSLFSQHLSSRTDFIHIDGRLSKEDVSLLSAVDLSNTTIALDDSESDEKGIANLQMLRRVRSLQSHIYIQPFTSDIFQAWGLATRSTTGIFAPLKKLALTRQ